MKRKLDENDVPKPVDGQTASASTFDHLGLDARLLQAVAKEGFHKPTPIQAQAIPLVLQGKDVVARAYTGSGKTAAYILPLLQIILQHQQTHGPSKAVRALVLVPTKELAQQVHKVTTALTAFCARDIKALNLSQKTSDVAQRSFLADSPHVIIATPAAVHTGIKTATLKLDELVLLVVDEADLVLSYGYEDDLAQIARVIPIGAQKILTSASIATEVEALKALFCQDPAVIAIDEAPDQGEKVQQYAVRCGEEEKFLLIYVILKLRLITGKVIVFVADVDRCYRLKLYLEQFGIRACILNPELPVNSRIHVVEEFNKNVYDIIIGSDEHEIIGDESNGTAEDETEASVESNGASAAKKPRPSKARSSTSSKAGNKPKDKEFGISRGIDFQRVACVLNFDLPSSPTSYLHRIGRTARAGRTGIAFSFAIPAHEQGRHKPTSLPSTLHDPKVLAAIIADQASRGKAVTDYAFDSAQIDAFRYRASDALKLVTRKAIREARTRELRQELITSARLKRHFDENPDDLRGLTARHDAPSGGKPMLAHLKQVPDYLLPAKDGIQSAATRDIGFVGPGPSEDNKRRKLRAAAAARAKGRAKAGPGRRGKMDPLRSFSAKGRGRKK